MSVEWTQEMIENEYLCQIEENSQLEYKGKDALGKSTGKKSEIAKDISAMANSAGGIVMYGIKEKNNLPENIEPININEFSREWLDQVIDSNIQPSIEGFKIHPVYIDSGENDVLYVVEIPQSMIAHQNLRDYRYYGRLNTTTYMMEDYQIRDVMNRAKKPKAIVKFYEIPINNNDGRKTIRLGIKIVNDGILVIKNFKLKIKIPILKFLSGKGALHYNDHHVNNIKSVKKEECWVISYSSDSVLLPEDEKDISEDLDIRIEINAHIHIRYVENKVSIYNKIFADDMIPFESEVLFQEIIDF